VKVVAEERTRYETALVPVEGIARLIKDLESQMKKAAKNLEFEKAALLRDRIIDLRKDEELLSPFHQQNKRVKKTAGNKVYNTVKDI